MGKEDVSVTFLDVSKGIGYGLIYHPVIGELPSKKNYPFISQFVRFRMKKIKKTL